jgi:hypothetical protein
MLAAPQMPTHSYNRLASAVENAIQKAGGGRMAEQAALMRYSLAGGAQTTADQAQVMKQAAVDFLGWWDDPNRDERERGKHLAALRYAVKFIR